MVITKQHMIDAARYEPLARGNWVQDIDQKGIEVLDRDRFTQDTLESSNSCPVCLVGGMLRQSGIKDPFTILNIASDMVEYPASDIMCHYKDESYAEKKRQHYKDIVGILLQSADYLSAASTFFESGLWQTRQDIIHWIETRIPKDWQHEIY